jgi:ABC-type enterochelin transport system permease subunit
MGLREQVRILENELARLAALSDSLDTRAGIAIGFAGAVAGLLVQVRHPNQYMKAAIVAAMASATIGVLAAFPRRMKAPDAEVIASYYGRLPEQDATSFTSVVRSTG